MLFVAGLTWPVALVGFAVSRLPVYATADAGISLADADNLLGRGIRPAGHVPVFAALTALARLMSSDLGAFRLLAVAAALALPASFLFFVHGRTRSPAAEVIGALLFAVAPTTAEAVGWYGLTMLVGIALALVALRMIDNWLIAPTQRRAMFAGAAVVLVSLTHAVPLLWAVEITAVFTVGHAVQMWNRHGRDVRAAARDPFWRTAPTAAVFFLVAGIVNLVNSSHLQSAVALAPGLGHLRLIWSFGFRHNVVWIAGLCFGLVGAPLVARLGRRDMRFALWGSATGWVAIFNLIALGGDASYQNRQVYLLAPCICVGLVVLVARGASLVRAAHYVPGVATIVAAVVVLAWSGHAFDVRLTQATRYYNRVTVSQVDALRWLKRHQGDLLVSPSDDDFYDGTTISWLAQGLARRRSISSTEGYRNLIESDRRGSDDAALLISGASGTVQRNIAFGRRASFGEMFVLGRYDNSWLPLAALRSDTGAVTATVVANGRLLVHLPPHATTLAVRQPDASELRSSPVTFDAARGVTVHVGDAVASNGGAEVEVKIDGPLQTRSARERDYAAPALLKERHIRWIWAPRGSRSDDEFAARGYSVAYSNQSVVIFDADMRRTRSR
ncbi:MAG: hypothetical protein QOG90_1010 [Actinomycetota bacterium]